MEIPDYIDAMKKKYGLANDYTLAKKLKISQPEANWFRRGKKVPNTAICIRMANLLGKNPVEVLLVAQKDRAVPEEKNHWSTALSAVDVMLKVPQRPRYIPQKIEAIGLELRQLESQILSYKGTIAQNEAVHLMKNAENCIDSLMERWQVWKRDGSLFPNYLLANQSAVQRGVAIRRAFILTASDIHHDGQVADFLQVLNDQRRAGIAVFFAYREELNASLLFQRLVQAFKEQGVSGEINTALFDDEVLIFSHSYSDRPLGVHGNPISITMIEQLDITWNPDHVRDLSPSPLFETRVIYPYRGERSFKIHLSRFRKSERVT